ncbi:hypothetical protein ACIQU6_44130 [Streptomyces sp. NPDC090442]|uniref:hypothetical protein n=1 Tax=Streptomyces sp. NPDC090442 TaxID=3365962 RepID=UPI0038256ADE
MTTATTTTDQPEPAPEIKQAEQEAAEAEQLLAALEERVRDGDEQVTAQQLTDARELGTFAKLRAEAARRKAERAAAKAAETERARITADAVALAEQTADPTHVATAYQQARAALAALVDAVCTHNGALGEAAALLRHAGAPPITRFVPVQRGEHTFNEPELVPASRTAPTVHQERHSATLSLKTGHTRAAIGAGAVLATLLEEITQTSRMDTPVARRTFLASPIQDQAQRHRDTVRHFLNTATPKTPKDTK